MGGGHDAVELYGPETGCESPAALSAACDIPNETISGRGAREIKDAAVEYRLNITGSGQREDAGRLAEEEIGELLPDRRGAFCRTSMMRRPVGLFMPRTDRGGSWFSMWTV